MLQLYFPYILTTFLATFFISITEHLKMTSRMKQNLWRLSAGVLIFVMGFRHYSVGVDGLSYIMIYDDINNLTLFEYYQHKSLEPGYYLFNRLIFWVFNDYQWIFIASAFLTISLFYKAIAYEVKNLSPSIVVFVFTLTQYFYYFGITRMGIAVAIVAYAYRYIIEDQPQKYIVFLVLASLFHYSSFFALFPLFLKVDKVTHRFTRKSIVKTILSIPLAFIGTRYLIYPFIKSQRYYKYLAVNDIISFNFLTSLPFLFLFTFFRKKLVRRSINYQFFYILYLVKVVTELFSPLIGIGRMVWFVNISIPFLLSAIYTISRDSVSKMIIIIMIVLYSLFYSYNAYFGESPRGKTMIPYRNVLINHY